jgi:hypothetical protein
MAAAIGDIFLGRSESRVPSCLKSGQAGIAAEIRPSSIALICKATYLE